MNIFITSECPIESAAYLDDKRVVKMVLETAQLLSTAVRSLGIEVGYASTHANHPCAKWARESRQNYEWTWHHGLALATEYAARYGKLHKSGMLLYILGQYRDRFPDIGLTEFANCAANKSFGIDYKNVKDIPLAYRLYLSDRWELDKRCPTWYGHGR